MGCVGSVAPDPVGKETWLPCALGSSGRLLLLLKLREHSSQLGKQEESINVALPKLCSSHAELCRLQSENQRERLGSGACCVSERFPKSAQKRVRTPSIKVTSYMESCAPALLCLRL